MRGKRLSIYIGDGDTFHARSLPIAILERLRKDGFLGATVTRGVAGYGGRAHIKTTEVEVASDLPVVITVVDASERIEAVVPEIVAMLAGGVVTVEDVDIRYFAGLFKAGFPDRRVADVMARDPESTTPDAQLVEVVTRLLARDYTALPVVDGAGHVVGMIDEAVLLDKGLTEMSLGLHKAIGASLVGEYLKRLADRGQTVGSALVATPTVTPEQPLRDAAHLMHARGLKRVPVVDATGRLVGMLGRLDILGSLASSHAHPLAPRADLPLAHRLVGDIMEPDAPTVTEDTPLVEVLERLLGSPLKRVVVVDADRRPVGIITDTDLAARIDPDERPGLVTVLRSRWNDEARHKLRRARGQRAGDLMSRPVIAVAATAPVAEALATIVTRHIKRLPVVDEAGRLVGMASRPALLAAALDLAG
jgi:CBS domain-containing protein